MIRQYVLLSIFLTLFICLSFLYHGAVVPPPLGDSHDYHIPIAQYFLEGKILSIPKTANPYINFPGASELILALFIFLHIPVNWFCLLGWIILFFLLRRLGIHFKLGSELSIIYAFAFITTLSVLRQITTQSIDMWMAVWFVLLLLLLEKPKKTIKYFLILGLLFGILIGSKYTGPFYMLVLLLVYGLQIIKLLNWSRTLAFIVPFLIFGVSWYLRNFNAWGNPFYPIAVLFFPGGPNMESLAEFILWKELLRGNGGTILEALASEYLLWGISFIPFLFLFSMNLKKRFLDERATRVFYICFLLFISSFFMYSFKPDEYHFVISNMRYMFPLIIMLILATFTIAKKYKYDKEIAIVTVLSAFAQVWLIPYHPKVVLIFFAISTLIYYKGYKYIDWFITNKT